MKPNVPKSVLRGALALSALALALAATEALASTAANTVITNTATVRFNDGAGVPQASVSATAQVTVTLVPSPVVLSSPVDTAIAQGATATLSYTITGTANGPDVYNLSSVATPTNVSAVVVGLPPSVSLGGTTLAADAVAGANAITVPYDGAAGASVNDIGQNDVVVVGLNEYVVASVTKDSATNTATIALATPIVGATVAAGQIVGERQTFTATVPSGAVLIGGSGSHSVTTTAASAVAPAARTPQATPTVVTVNRPTLTVTKTVSVDGGTTFAASGSAIPGTVLVYKIVARNTGSTDATAVAFTDIIPPYLSYRAGETRWATTSGTAYDAATALVEGAGGLTWTSATRTLSYDPGGATGTVAGGGELVLFYRATID